MGLAQLCPGRLLLDQGPEEILTCSFTGVWGSCTSSDSSFFPGHGLHSTTCKPTGHCGNKQCTWAELWRIPNHPQNHSFSHKSLHTLAKGDVHSAKKEGKKQIQTGSVSSRAALPLKTASTE